MNDKIPITKPLHPKFIIQYAVNSVVRNRYGLNWEPRVVRQEIRKIEGSVLSSIDYAIPCFDLAREIGKDVTVVAGEIAKELKTKFNDSSETEYFKFIHSENIHGYLNFEVSDSFLIDVIKNSAEWYGKPTKIIQSTPISMSIMGYDISDITQNTNLMNCLKLLESVSDAAGGSIQMHIELPDASTEALGELAKRLVQSEGANMETSAIVQKKKFLRNKISQPSSLHQLGQEYQAFLNQIMGPLLQMIDGSKVKSSSQLHVIESVNRALREITSEANILTDLLIVDEASLAIYLSFEETVVPVRSAEGFLYPAAYMLHHIRADASQQSGTCRVLISPHKHHGLLHLLTARLQTGTDYIFFDPFVSRADIEEIVASGGALGSLLGSVHRLITGARSLGDLPFSRPELFFIADFAMDISLSLREVQLPLLFDYLNHLARTITSVASDEDLD